MSSSSTMHSVQYGLKATIAASLIALTHMLIITSGHTKLDPGISQDITVLSALICLTLSWVTFTLLEGSDLDEARPHTRVGKVLIVCSSAGVETICGALALFFWLVFGQERSATVFHELSSPKTSPDTLGLMPLTYNIALFSLIALNIHTLYSVISYINRVTVGDALTGGIWAGRMGWWERSIELTDEDIAGNEKIV